jgi:hypothetical protein
VNAPAGTTFQSVTAVWNIPQVFSSADDGGSYYASYWIGIDGSGSPDVFQAGIQSESSGYSGALRTQYAWWEWYPEISVLITNFPVSPGQSILCLLTATSNIAGNVLLINQATGLSITFVVTPPSNTSLVGNCAEWIVERPKLGGVFSTLADYGEMNFNGCFAGTSTGTTIQSSAGDDYNMTNGAQIVSQGTLQGAAAVKCVYTGPSHLWTAGQSINDSLTTSSSPGACLFDNQLYVFGRAADGTNSIWYVTSPDGSSWSDPSLIDTVDSSPDGFAPCVFNNQLYMFWQAGNSDHRIYYKTSPDGSSWSNAATINNSDSTPQALAACTFNNQLYVFWKANDASNHIYYSASSDGVSWPSGTMINNHDSTPFGLAACVFNNKLFLFWRANDVSNLIYVSASSDGVSWPLGTAINNVDFSTAAPAVCAFQNDLFLIWKSRVADQFSRIFFSVSLDGSSWPAGQPITSTDTTAGALAACAFTTPTIFGGPVIFWRTTDSRNHIFFSQWQP